MTYRNAEQDITLAELTAYLENLSYETISRNPDSRLHFAPMAPEHRTKLLIDASEVQRRRQGVSVKARLRGWTLWTIDGFSGAKGPEPHLIGISERAGGQTFMTTSEVVAIADDLSCLFTLSGSLYELATEQPKPTADTFFHLVLVLIEWGYQRELELPAFC